MWGLEAANLQTVKKALELGQTLAHSGYHGEGLEKADRNFPKNPKFYPLSFTVAFLAHIFN